MIEEIVIKYLNDVLNVPVYPIIPPDEQDESFVLVERIGGSTENHIQYATLAIQSYAGNQSYAESIRKAAALNEEVKKAMDNIITLNSVFKSKLNSDYNFTDTTMEKYRYQAVYDLVY